MSIADSDLSCIAMCWRLERLDGAGIALTSHDQRLLRDNVSFEPAPGMMPAAITRSLGLDPDESEVAGALSSDALDEEDLALGRWDGATMQLMAVDWTESSTPPIKLLGGEIGSVTIDGDRFSADLHGAAARLDDPVCPATSAECRAEFGDKQCRVDLAGRSVVATVLEASENELTIDRDVDDQFRFGRLRFVSGANCGWTSVIMAVEGSMVRIRDLPRAAVDSGCRVELREGCDKRFATCKSRFANAANFRGEPHLPGNDLLTRYPGA